MHPLLHHTDHRPYPVPPNSWLMTQTWVDLLFAHWPIDPAALRSIVPAQLEIDTFDGTAWIGVVPFGMVNIHFKDVPCVPLFDRFLELNVRTYVRARGHSAVYFFSLDAANPVAVEVARTWFHLPYFNARMSKTAQGGNIHYHSTRKDRRGREAVFEARYKPIGEPFASQPGTLEHWLTERYCFLVPNNKGLLVVGNIHHKPWPLQLAEAEITRNGMVQALGLEQPRVAPLLHFAREIETLEWPIAVVPN
jgi:uncharacterized protein YqjF (DUF2071 family)